METKKKEGKKRLSEKDFERIVNNLQLSERSREIAYGVLVLGQKQKFFCEKYNITPPAVSSLCKRIYRLFVPEGYEMIEAVLPRHKAFIVKKWLEDEKNKNRQ